MIEFPRGKKEKEEHLSIYRDTLSLKETDHLMFPYLELYFYTVSSGLDTVISLFSWKFSLLTLIFFFLLSLMSQSPSVVYEESFYPYLNH